MKNQRQMKTPMQELIDWNDMYRPLNHPNGTEVLSLKLKQMLEKEKDVMCSFAVKHFKNDRDMFVTDLFDETFNTKEK